MKGYRVLLGLVATSQIVVGASQVLAQTSNAKAGPATRQITSAVDREYGAAIALFRQGKLAEAEPAFGRIAEKRKGTLWGEYAQFQLAETQYRLKRYAQANGSFETLIALYPGTQFLDKVVAREYAIALLWLSKNEGSALRTLELVRFHNPDGPLATAALIKTAVHHMERGHDAMVINCCEQLISDRPRALWLTDVLRLQCIQREPMQGQVEANEAVKLADPPEIDDWAAPGKAGAKRFRNQLEGLLTKKIDEVDQMFVLTAPQRDKLRLAGHGDIKRLLEAVEDSRREFDLAKQDIDRLSEVRKNLRTLDLLVSFGPFELGSLFQKTLRKMFEEKQLKRRSPGEKGTSVGV